MLTAATCVCVVSAISTTSLRKPNRLFVATRERFPILAKFPSRWTSRAEPRCALRVVSVEFAHARRSASSAGPALLREVPYGESLPENETFCIAKYYARALDE